jgi:hypothetical protein
MTDVETVKMLSGNPEVSDDFVAFQLQSVEALLLSYCNVDSLPEGLRNVYLEIAAFKVKANTDGSKVVLGAGAKNVASLGDGNQTVSFSAMGASAIDWNSDAAILGAYADILGRYRKMIVSKPVDYDGRRNRGPKR